MKKQKNRLASDLLEFIENSPSSYHVIHNVSKRLQKKGFVELHEQEKWNLIPGNYYVQRNDSSVIAFSIPKLPPVNFQLIASHSDSPCFKIKTNPELLQDGHYVVLNVEKYGGFMLNSWFDRPLSIAGRVIVKTDLGYEKRLVNLDQNLLMIPNLAIHMNHKVNEGYAINPQKEMLPLMGSKEVLNSFGKLIAKEAEVSEEELISWDLFLYNRMKGMIWGARDEFMSSPRLDDLQCAFSSIEALLNSQNQESILMSCIFDNEEVGSTTGQGADSDFLSRILDRIASGLGFTSEEYQMLLAESFMISADNAHSVHPNYLEKSDPTNRPYMNEGIVIKNSANQKYTSDAVSSAVIQELCHQANIPYQFFANRSDQAGGSTLGNISNSHISLHTVDLGAAQLAMHSAYETAGVKDTEYLVAIMEKFYKTTIRWNRDHLFYLT